MAVTTSDIVSPPDDPGGLPALPEGSLLSSAQQGDSLAWYDLPIESVVRYITDEGIFGAPVADGPNGICLPMRLHSPMTHKVVWYRVRRVAEKPILPAPLTSNQNEVLIHRQIGAVVPRLMRDEETRVFEQEVVYVYLLIATPGTNEPIGVGTTPDTVLPPEVNTIEPQQFDQSLFRSAAPSNFNPTLLQQFLNGAGQQFLSG